MRQLQEGNQGPRRSGSCWIRLAGILVLQELRKADHRVPEEAQVSPAGQDGRLADRRDSSTRVKDRNWRGLFSLSSGNW